MSRRNETMGMANQPSQTLPRFTILIDGLCPLCRIEGDMLTKLDRGRGLLRILDFTQQNVKLADFGLTYEQVMGQIHGVNSGGEISTGMGVFREAYSTVGWGWLWAPTGWPILKPIFDRLYIWFARNRLRLTGRKDDCTDGRCAIKP